MLYRDVLFGIAVADALGVPAEFKSRAELASKPVLDMGEGGAHRQLRGTWSDDTSMSLCLAEALLDGYDPQRVAQSFVAWWKDGYWTPRGECFDIGIGTQNALRRIQQGLPALQAGGAASMDNGNGALMRILPALFYTRSLPLQERIRITRELCSITHAHIRSHFACVLYTEYAHILLSEKCSLPDAYVQLLLRASELAGLMNVPKEELVFFERFLSGRLATVDQADIRSSGYVIDSLEAAFWCLLRGRDYKETCLMAVNLGNDTDTIAAIAGGLAGLKYGFASIPDSWLNVIARKEDISALCNRWEKLEK